MTSIKNSKIKEIVVILLILVITKFGVNTIFNSDFSFDKLRYTLNMMNIEKIDTKELKGIVNKNSEKDVKVIFMGRITCPYCVESSDKVKKIRSKFSTVVVNSNKVNIHYYYFDTKKNNDKETLQLRNDIGANYVPNFVILKDGEVKLFEPSELSEEDYLERFSTLLKS